MRCISVAGLLGGLLLVGGSSSAAAQAIRGVPTFAPSRPAVVRLVARGTGGNVEQERRPGDARLAPGAGHERSFSVDGWALLRRHVPTTLPLRAVDGTFPEQRLQDVHGPDGRSPDDFRLDDFGNLPERPLQGTVRPGRRGTPPDQAIRGARTRDGHGRPLGIVVRVRSGAGVGPGAELLTARLEVF